MTSKFQNFKARMLDWDAFIRFAVLWQGIMALITSTADSLGLGMKLLFFISGTVLIYQYSVSVEVDCGKYQRQMRADEETAEARA